MLVLSRQREQSIYFDFSQMTDDELRALRENPIQVQVVDVRGDKVRQGITAPKFVGVHRKEVYEVKQREREEAAKAVQTASAD